jgi:serine/threonine protein kinase
MSVAPLWERGGIVTVSVDDYLLDLLANGPPLSPGERAALAEWWRAERQDAESLAAFLVRHEVITRTAARTLDTMFKGYVHYPDARHLFQDAGLARLRARLAPAPAPAPAPVAPVPVAPVPFAPVPVAPVPFATAVPPPVAPVPEPAPAPATAAAAPVTPAPVPAADTPAAATRPVPSRSSELPAGTVVGQFRIASRIGRGAKGVVYEAEDVGLGRPAAVKLLLPELTADPLAVKRFLVEARVASKLDHPNCLGVFSIGRYEDTVWFAMPLIRGSAQDAVDKRGPLPPAEAVRIVRLAAQGLSAPHAMGIVHGNIKPSNLLLDDRGEVRVGDFGTGGLAETAFSEPAAVARWTGTAHYLSPEQCCGAPLDPRTDVYALGAVLFTLLTGRPPFADLGTAAVLFKHAVEPHPDPRRSNPSVPDACVGVINRAMAKDPTARYRDGLEMAEALGAVERALVGEADQSRHTQMLSRLSRPTAGGPVGDPRNLPMGTVLGKCLLTERIGQGGAGVVFRALHQGLNIPVAVKVLHTDTLRGDAAAFEQLRTEARMMARLNHPNIVRIWDFDDSGDFPFLVMEYVNGLTLRELIAQSGALRPERAVRIVRQVAQALEAALETEGGGIIHRDIKPANILLAKDGQAKLADLGLAVMVGHRAGMSATGEVMVGTAAYMSPEQAMTDGAVDHRSDIYSLGATLYHAVTGQVPFKGRNLMETMLKHAKEPPVPPQQLVGEIDAKLSETVLRMLAKDPAERHQSYGELLADLESLKSGSRVFAPAPPTSGGSSAAGRAGDSGRQSSLWQSIVARLSGSRGPVQ